MKKTLIKSASVLRLTLAVALATTPSHATFWRSSEEPSPTKKATTTKHATTTHAATKPSATKQASRTKAPASTTTLAGTKMATSAKPTTSAKPAPTTRTAATSKAKATAKGGATEAHAATSIGSDGQVVYHSVNDWQPGSLNRHYARSAPRPRGGKSREQAVEVALTDVQP